MTFSPRTTILWLIVLGVGTYKIAPGINMVVWLATIHLTTQLTGQQQIPVYPNRKRRSS